MTSREFTLIMRDHKVHTGTLEVPVVEPMLEGWLVEAGDGQKPVRNMHDQYYSDRAPQQITNEVNPIWEVDPDTGRVSHGSKHIAHLHRSYNWWYWLADMIGEENAKQFVQAKPYPADGFMDANDGTVPLGDVYDPNPDKELKLMVASTGGGLLNGLRTIQQSGNRFEVIETMDYNTPPEKVDSTWLYQGQVMNWFTHPHRFTSRVNRTKINDPELVRWQTKEEIGASTDFRKGDEHWPMPTTKELALQHNQLHFYPTLPFTAYYSPDSYVVDGYLRSHQGKQVEIDAYNFYGSQVWGRASGEWLKLEEMLVDPVIAENRGVANAFGWRCYCSMENIYPYISYRAWGVPIAGWNLTYGQL